MGLFFHSFIRRDSNLDRQDEDTALENTISKQALSVLIIF